MAIFSADSTKYEVQCGPAYITRLKLIGVIITGAVNRKRMEERYQDVTKDTSSDAQIRERDFVLHQETETQFRYEGVIGDSAAMKKVFSRIERVAMTDSAVLVWGRGGYGKSFDSQRDSRVKPA